MNQTYIESAEDKQWLQDTHLVKLGVHLRPYDVAILFGNEDSPDKIALYARNDYRSPYQLIDYTEPAPVFATITDITYKPGNAETEGAAS